jgi:hypothetical protein
MIRRSSAVVGFGLLLFVLTQSLSAFIRPHCYDCGAKVGFPFPYNQEGLYATHGHIIWLGLIGDLAVAVGISACAVWLWYRARISN